MKSKLALLSVIALFGIAQPAHAGISVTYSSGYPAHHYTRPYGMPVTYAHYHTPRVHSRFVERSHGFYPFQRPYCNIHGRHRHQHNNWRH